MKNFKYITLAFALIIILFAGCKNPADDVQIVVDTDIFKSPTLIQFVNAKAGAEGPKSFNVEIVGPGANLVRTITGGKVFKTAEGYLNLVLDREANPSPTAPVKFTVIANTVGYAPTYLDVTITSATDPTIYKVPMVEYANPTAGSGVVVATRAITGGTSSADLSFTTATNAGMSQKSDIVIPNGTTFFDASGASVGGNQLEARVVYSGFAADGSFASLPGDGFAANLIGANGQPVPAGAYLDPVGSVSINMFANGKEVKSFNKPVTLDIEINSTIINPTTNQPIKENETIPLWSLNSQTGQWKNEGNATVVKNAANILVARAQINHLSDWVFAYPANAGCTTSITINRTTDKEDETFTFTDLVKRSTGSFTLKKGEKTKTFSGGIIRSANKLTVTAGSDIYVNRQITSPQSTFCGKNTVFDFVEKPDLVGVDLDIKFKCTTKDLLTGINSFITITPIGASSGSSSSYSLTKGIGSGTITNGVTYKIVASVDGVAYTSQFTADKKNFVLPSGFDLTGTVVFDANTNRLKIVGQVTKDCN